MPESDTATHLLGSRAAPPVGRHGSSSSGPPPPEDTRRPAAHKPPPGTSSTACGVEFFSTLYRTLRRAARGGLLGKACSPRRYDSFRRMLRGVVTIEQCEWCCGKRHRLRRCSPHPGQDGLHEWGGCGQLEVLVRHGPPPVAHAAALGRRHVCGEGQSFSGLCKSVSSKLSITITLCSCLYVCVFVRRVRCTYGGIGWRGGGTC